MIALTAVVVHRWLCDHFGHMNVRHYAGAFDDATFVLWNKAGFVAGGDARMPVTLETRTQFRQEAQEGAILHVSAGVVRIGGKSVSLRFTLTDGESVIATCDVVECFIDPATRSSCAIPDAIRSSLETLPKATAD